MSQLGVRTDVGPTSVDAGFRIPTALLQQAAVLHPLAGQAATDRLAMTEPEDGLCSCNDPRERTGCGDAPGVAGALGDGDPGTVLTGGDEVAGGVEPPEPESPEPPRDEPSGAGTVVGVVGSAPVVNLNASPSVNSKERDVRNLTTTSTTVGELTGGPPGCRRPRWRRRWNALRRCPLYRTTHGRAPSSGTRPSATPSCCLP